MTELPAHILRRPSPGKGLGTRRSIAYSSPMSAPISLQAVGQCSAISSYFRFACDQQCASVNAGPSRASTSYTAKPSATTVPPFKT